MTTTVLYITGEGEDEKAITLQALREKFDAIGVENILATGDPTFAGLAQTSRNFEVKTILIHGENQSRTESVIAELVTADADLRIIASIDRHPAELREATHAAKTTGPTIAELQDAGHLTKPERYTSVSKGGSYTKLGAIRGAGALKGLAGIAYQNEKGDLFIREPECFAKRMLLVEQGGAS